jgi:hypothetical protein
VRAERRVREPDRAEEPELVDVAHDRLPRRDPREALGEARGERADVRQEAGLVDEVEHALGHDTAELGAAAGRLLHEGITLEPRREPRIVDARRHRVEAAGHALPEHDGVGLHVEVLEGPELAGAAPAGLDLVEHERHVGRAHRADSAA